MRPFDQVMRKAVKKWAPLAIMSAIIGCEPIRWQSRRSSILLDNILKKRLAMIKARARRLHQAGAFDPAAEPGTKPGRFGVTVDAPFSLAAGLETYADGNLLPGLRLEDVVKGREQRIEDACFYLIRMEGEDIDPEAGRVAAAFRGEAEAAAWNVPTNEQVAEVEPAEKLPPLENITKAGPDPLRGPRDGVCFFDIETTGLSSSTYAFLCGLMFLEGERLIVEQLFARDYDEERGVMMYLRKRLADFLTIVTYNGVTFDIPFIRARMAVNRLEFEENFSHLDLLQSARRVYSGLLDNCRLGTVERHLRGVGREGDILGGEIPEAYHDFVRTKRAEVMERVLYHNRMDLLALVILYNRLWPAGMPEIGR
jgi:uncharacterized protein YprB with RNaseH-like and TPR domain